MSTDQFLTIATIPGESADDRHRGAIDVLDWSWAVSNARPPGGGGAGRVGRPDLADLVVTHGLDAATPRLFEACALGRRLAHAVLAVRRAGTSEDFLSIRLEDVVVTSVSTSSAGDVPVNQLTLRFDEVTMTYRSQLDDGSLGAPVTFTYDRTN